MLRRSIANSTTRTTSLLLRSYRCCCVSTIRTTTTISFPVQQRLQSQFDSPIRKLKYISISNSNSNNNNKSNSNRFHATIVNCNYRSFSDKTPSDDTIHDGNESSEQKNSDETATTTNGPIKKIKKITEQKLDKIVAAEVPPSILSVTVNEGGVERMIAAPEDPFGLFFQDGSNQLGPILPPIYERDSITGRVMLESSDSTSSSTTTPGYKQQVELSDEDKYLLSLDTIERDMKLHKNVQEHYISKDEKSDDASSSSTTGGGDEHIAPGSISTPIPSNTTTIPPEVIAIGERIRATHAGTNIFGRSVLGQLAKEVTEDGTEQFTRYENEQVSSQPLTIDEYRTLEQYIKQNYNTTSANTNDTDDVSGMDAVLSKMSMDDIPVSVNQKPTFVPQPKKKVSKYSFIKKDEEEKVEINPDDAELSLKWLSSRAQRQMDDSSNDNPYSDLMPSDLSPQKLVNRKQAKIIPKKIVHFNNVQLLQHFIVPETGQIRNRMQTRLGARDQRRIKRCIKRARHIGLIPYNTQFKVETHGWINDPTIHITKSWEQSLIERGLVIQKSSKQQQHIKQQTIAYMQPPKQQLTATTPNAPTTTGSNSGNNNSASTMSPLPPMM